LTTPSQPADDVIGVTGRKQKANSADLRNVDRPTDELRRVREWAREKIQGGSEPPWAWYQYMKLIETVDAILDGIAATTTTESLQQLAQHPEKHLRLVESTSQPDIFPRRRAASKVRMPM
jgi:hypothetical protein